MTHRVLSIFGTRPEAIKMAPVVRALEASADFTSQVCVTGQHRQMLDQVLDLFELRPDFDLGLMRKDQDLFDITANALLGLRDVLRETRPDFVLVQGDTTTCMAGALAAFYEGVPVGHVEAGLRTFDLRAPFPEEANRTLVSQLARVHFAPTATAKANLLRGGIREDWVEVTGNTVIDALLIVCQMLDRYPDDFFRDTFGHDLFDRLAQRSGPVVLVTGHRRESFGRSFEQFSSAIRDLSIRHPDWLFVYPVHLNPNVRRPVFSILAGLANVALIEPLDYLPFVWAMRSADLILTDSGGVQEEAPSLGKPVLVTREVTERPEAVEAGTVLLVGTDRERIMSSIEAILGSPERYAQMSRAHNPYGDGRATERILRSIGTLLRTGGGAP
jgi:UDP-N-acetylglucosamine 2-epimerase (non-hydrolysing)